LARVKHLPQPFRLPPPKGAKPLKSKAVDFYWFSPFGGGAAIAAGGGALKKIILKNPRGFTHERISCSRK
jgi:hypothetical protein